MLYSNQKTSIFCKKRRRVANFTEEIIDNVAEDPTFMEFMNTSMAFKLFNSLAYRAPKAELKPKKPNQPRFTTSVWNILLSVGMLTWLRSLF